MRQPTVPKPSVHFGSPDYRGPAELSDTLARARESGATRDAQALEKLVHESDVWLNDEPMPELNAKRLRARILDPEADYGRWEERLPGARVPNTVRRWLIPGLWPWGTTPLLTGQPKAGKSTIVADLVAALAIPDRQFLGHFEPTSFNPHENAAGITVISAEGTPEDYERELLRLGVSDDPDDTSQAPVTLFHLEADQLSFDLTDHDVFDEWLYRLAKCNRCDGSDDMIPTVIIVDGLTAVLQNAGKGVEQYAAWIAAFRRLQHQLRTPNALVVGHSTFRGGHSLGNTEGSAQSDGLWVYLSTDPDNPAAKRKFKVTPRLGGVSIPPTRVDLVEGRLILATRDAETYGAAVPAENTQAPAWNERNDSEAMLIDFVAEHHAATGQWPTTSELRGAKVPRRRLAEVRDQLIVEGRLEKSKLPQAGGGSTFSIPEAESESSK